jgi:putative SOS response-associated peptidase YedK
VAPVATARAAGEAIPFACENVHAITGLTRDSGYATHMLVKRPDGKQPYFISADDGRVLSFAGLWDRWKNSETGEPAISCTIIVTNANELTRPIHDRMAVVLPKTDIGRGLPAKAARSC